MATPSYAGYQATKNMKTGDVTQNYSNNGMKASVSQDAQGNVTRQTAGYKVGDINANMAQAGDEQFVDVDQRATDAGVGGYASSYDAGDGNLQNTVVGQVGSMDQTATAVSSDASGNTNKYMSDRDTSNMIKQQEKDIARLNTDKLFNDVNGEGPDTVSMGVPLLIRMFEFAREEAQTDKDLHDVVKKMLDMGGNVTMDDYDEIMSSVGGEESEMEEAVGDKLTDLEYGSATATATPTVGGYHQRRDLETGSYTDYTDRGPISTQTTYDKSGQMTSQHAQARVGDHTMARSRFYHKKNESEELRRLAGLATEDYVGSREAPQDLVKSLSKSYKDFVKEVEQQNAAKPDRELRSKTEKPRKFGNILGEE